MYSMLVVDDEVRERNIVRLLFQQKYENQFYINEAGSGEETLKILEEGQADLLIIDIQMPGMNGLETVKKIRETNKQIYIIILTAYNYFEYAKEAIEAGVNDFLLKPLIREELKKAIDKFFQHYMDKNYHINSSEEERETKDLLSKELVSLLSFSSKDAPEIDRYINLLNIEEKEGYCAVFHPLIGDSHLETSRNYLKEIQNHLEDMLKKEHKNYIINRIGGKIVIFFFVKHLDEAEEIWIYDLLKKTSEYVHIKISLGKGEAYPIGIKLHNSFIEALAQLNHTIVELNTIEYEKIVSKNIKEHNIQKATSIIKDLLIAMNTENQYDKIKFKIIEILTEVTKKTLDQEIQGRLLDELSFIIQIEEMEQLIKFIEGYMKKIGEELESISNAKSHYIVDQVVQYIKEHYNEPLSVEELAGQFYISSFYLSKLFKDKQKLCFTDYVTNYRINKAIELMEDASKNIKNIACEVGYVDANYFSRVFKKKMGIGPREYRKNYVH